MQMLDALYEKEDRVQARKVAVKLDKALRDWPEFAESIRGDEVRALLAELRGDHAACVRHREREIRRIFHLHSISRETEGWAYVSACYDYSDISDRLDLLALAYDSLGDLETALSVIRESKAFCESHSIPFDGQDVLDELEQAAVSKDGAR